MNSLAAEITERLRSFEEPIVNGIINRIHLDEMDQEQIQLFLDDEENRIHPETRIGIDIDKIITEKYLTVWKPLMGGTNSIVTDQLLLDLIGCRIYYGKELAEIKYQQSPQLFLEYHSKQLTFDDLVENPMVEHQVIKRVKNYQKVAGDVSCTKVVQLIFNDIIELNKHVQVMYLSQRMRHLRVGYLGPEGTYASQVSHKYFPRSINLEPIGSHNLLFELLDKKELDMIVVPIKNSQTGMIIEVDLDRHLPVKMIDYNVVIDLLAPPGGRLGEIETIHSHIQAYNEARPWLEMYIPDAKFVPSTSTIKASKRVVSMGTYTQAALSTRNCADQLGLSVVAKNIAGSVTTFYILRLRNQ